MISAASIGVVVIKTRVNKIDRIIIHTVCHYYQKLLNLFVNVPGPHGGEDICRGLLAVTPHGLKGVYQHFRETYRLQVRDQMIFF
jgi:hypothetical protein